MILSPYLILATFFLIEICLCDQAPGPNCPQGYVKLNNKCIVEKPTHPNIPLSTSQNLKVNFDCRDHEISTPWGCVQLSMDSLPSTQQMSNKDSTTMQIQNKIQPTHKKNSNTSESTFPKSVKQQIFGYNLIKQEHDLPQSQVNGVLLAPKQEPIHEIVTNQFHDDSSKSGMAIKNNENRSFVLTSPPINTPIVQQMQPSSEKIISYQPSLQKNLQNTGQLPKMQNNIPNSSPALNKEFQAIKQQTKTNFNNLTQQKLILSPPSAIILNNSNTQSFDVLSSPILQNITVKTGVSSISTQNRRVVDCKGVWIEDLNICMPSNCPQNYKWNSNTKICQQPLPACRLGFSWNGKYCMPTSMIENKYPQLNATQEYARQLVCPLGRSNCNYVICPPGFTFLNQICVPVSKNNKCPEQNLTAQGFCNPSFILQVKVDSKCVQGRSKWNGTSCQLL